MSDRFSITIPNLAKLQEALANAPEIAAPILQSAIVGAQALLAKAKGVAHLPYRTGVLSQNWAFEVGTMQARYYPRAFYAPYVEFGTGIYGPKGEPIRPQVKQALYWPGADHPMRSVKGQHPNPFMERIVEAAQPEIANLFGQALEKIMAALAAQSQE
jgi:hypothetical protein